MDRQNLSALIDVLEVVCTECGGKDSHLCGSCDQTGYMLTKTGESVFSFLGRLTLRQASRHHSESFGTYARS
jgi:hypothetical protein